MKIFRHLLGMPPEAGNRPALSTRFESERFSERKSCFAPRSFVP
jgi:hypothetical protein